jgi:hypothetical protein
MEQNIYIDLKMSTGQEQWLNTVILATWEAEIGRITIQGHPRQKGHETPISTNGCMVACTCHQSYEKKHK